MKGDDTGLENTVDPLIRNDIPTRDRTRGLCHARNCSNGREKKKSALDHNGISPMLEIIIPKKPL